jgi:hypothetical protein
MPIYANKLVNSLVGVLMEIIVIPALVGLVILLLLKNPKASFVMLLLGGFGWMIGDFIHYSPFVLSILSGAIGLSIATKEFKTFTIPVVVIILVGIVGNLIGNIFSTDWGTYGSLFGVSIFIGLILQLFIEEGIDSNNIWPLITPSLLLIIAGLLYIVVPAVFSGLSGLFSFMKSIFSSGWNIWIGILVVFGALAYFKNAKEN